MGLSVPCSVVAVNLQRLQGAPIVRESEVEFVTATLGTDVVVVADGIWQRPQKLVDGCGDEESRSAIVYPLVGGGEHIATGGIPSGVDLEWVLEVALF